MAFENGLDLAELDSEPTQLHLAVAPTDVVQFPVGGQACQVARAVDPLAVPPVGMRDEAHGSQIRSLEIPNRELPTRHVHLTDDTGSNRLQS